MKKQILLTWSVTLVRIIIGWHFLYEGIIALLCNPSLARIIHKYWAETGGKIQFFSDCQMGGDFNLVNSILPQVQNRKRPWCG